jgi:hypothetical protein
MTNGYSALIAGRYDAERFPAVSQWMPVQKEVLSAVPEGKRIPVMILHFWEFGDGSSSFIIPNSRLCRVFF